MLDALLGFAPRWPRLPYPRRMRAAWRWSGWLALLDGVPTRMHYATPTAGQRAAYERLVTRAGELAPVMGGLGFAAPGVARDAGVIRRE